MGKWLMVMLVGASLAGLGLAAAPAGKPPDKKPADKPADKKPAEKPPEKKPADKPGEKPGDKPPDGGAKVDETQRLLAEIGRAHV